MSDEIVSEEERKILDDVRAQRAEEEQKRKLNAEFLMVRINAASLIAGGLADNAGQPEEAIAYRAVAIADEIIRICRGGKLKSRIMNDGQVAGER